MIKETTQLQGFNNIKLPKIKGEVEIKLHNPTTGKTEVHKGENMITNAVYDIFASNYCGTMNYANMLPLATKMFGGILCFANDLDISSADAAKDYYIPNEGTNSLIAHAGQTPLTDQADDLKRGNPLSSSMTFQDGSATLAWEWGITAGNGTFKSLALTHADTGSFGTGANNSAFKTFVPVITGSQISLDRPIQFVDKRGFAYYITVNGTTVTFNKYPIAYAQAGIVESLVPQSAYVETFTVTTTTSFSSDRAPGYHFNIDNDKLFLFYNDSIYETHTLYVEEIDIVAKTATNRNITNQDINFRMFADSYMAGFDVPMYGTYVYIAERPNGFSPTTQSWYKIDVTNPADTTQLTVPVATNFLAPCFTPPYANKILPSSEWVINNGINYITGNTDSYEYQSGYSRLGSSTKMTVTGLTSLVSRISGSNIFVVRASKLYLATKYNLSSSVTKSASQSMVITYTITEVAPNE